MFFFLLFDVESIFVACVIGVRYFYVFCLVLPPLCGFCGYALSSILLFTMHHETRHCLHIAVMLALVYSYRQSTVRWEIQQCRLPSLVPYTWLSDTFTNDQNRLVAASWYWSFANVIRSMESVSVQNTWYLSSVCGHPSTSFACSSCFVSLTSVSIWPK